MKPVKKIFLAVGLVTAVGVAGWWWYAGQQQQVVAAALPPAPDLGSAVPELGEKLAVAGQRARAHWNAGKGLVELSRLYHANGFLAEAAQCYTGLEKLSPNEPRWPHLHATILAGFGEIEPALALWRRVVELAPDYLPARLRLGDCLLKINRPDEAAAVYNEVLKRDAANSYALLGLARIDFEASRWDQARTRLETVVNQTNYNLGYDLIVSLYEKTGQHDRAEAIRGNAKASGAYRDAPDPWLDQLVDFCFDPYRLSLVAGVAGQTGDLAGATRLLERAAELAPEDVSVRFQLGGVAEANKDLKTAMEQYERCTILAPDFADGWAHLSELQAQTHQVAAAERTLAAGLARCPDSPGLHLQRARNLKDAGRTFEAIGEFQASIRLRPNEPDAYVELGNLYIQAGNEPEGVRLMHQAYEADPGHPMALLLLAFSSINAHDEAGARQWLERVANQPRVQPQFRQQLLDTYRQTFGHPFKPDRVQN